MFSLGLHDLEKRLKDRSSRLPNITGKTGSLDLNALETRLKERNKELKAFTLIPGPSGKDGNHGEKGQKGKDGLSIKGDKGDKGDKGETGVHGKGIKGDPGPIGKDGKDGKDGKQGISVIDTWIAADNHLVIKLSNGKEIDAGNIEANVQHILSTQVASSNLENGISLPIRNVTGTYSVIPSDYTLYVTSGTFTITLPDAIVNLGKVFNIKNKGLGITTVATTSSQTIDDSISITVPNDTNVQLQSTGTDWIII